MLFLFLSGQDLSTHSLHAGGQENLVVMPSSENDERFTEDNLTLMQQQLLNDPEFKIHHSLQVSMGNVNAIYTNNVRT